MDAVGGVELGDDVDVVDGDCAGGICGGGEGELDGEPGAVGAEEDVNGRAGSGWADEPGDAGEVLAGGGDRADADAVLAGGVVDPVGAGRQGVELQGAGG